MSANPVTMPSGKDLECDGMSCEWVLIRINHEKPNADTYYCVSCAERRVMPSPHLPPVGEDHD